MKRLIIMIGLAGLIAGCATNDQDEARGGGTYNTGGTWGTGTDTNAPGTMAPAPGTPAPDTMTPDSTAPDTDTTAPETDSDTEIDAEGVR